MTQAWRSDAPRECRARAAMPVPSAAMLSGMPNSTREHREHVVGRGGERRVGGRRGVDVDGEHGGEVAEQADAGDDVQGEQRAAGAGRSATGVRGRRGGRGDGDMALARSQRRRAPSSAATANRGSSTRTGARAISSSRRRRGSPPRTRTARRAGATVARVSRRRLVAVAAAAVLTAAGVLEVLLAPRRRRPAVSAAAGAGETLPLYGADARRWWRSRRSRPRCWSRRRSAVSWSARR